MNQKNWKLGLLAGTCVVAIPATAWAQSATTPPATTKPATTQPANGQLSNDQIAAIVVTGSRLVTNGNLAPTPVTRVSTEELSQLSSASIPDALEMLPQFNGSTSTAHNSYSVPTTESTATNLDLRNLGPQRVLTLFDGMRLVPEANTGLVDSSLIPQMLVKQVDVVAGGASAAYGSDAVSGVVNFVLDKKFNGISYLAQGFMSQRDDDGTERFGLAAGKDFLGGRLHLEGSVEFTHSNGIGAVSDRPLGNGNAAQLALGPGAAGTPANPFTYVSGVQNLNLSNGGYLYSKTPGTANNGTLFGPGGTLIAPVDGTIVGANCYNCNFTAHDPNLITLIPRMNKFQAFERADFEVSDHVNLYVEGLYADARASENTDGTISRPSPSSAFTIYSNNAYLNQIAPALAASIPAAGDYLSRMSIDMGPNTLSTNNSTYMLTAGANGDIFTRFKWDFGYSHSHSSQKLDLYNLDDARTRAAVDAVVNPANGQIVCNVTLTNPGLYPGCVPLNLFGQGSPSSAAIAYIHGDALQHTTFDQDVVEANLRGDLFKGWAGPITAAVGAAYRAQTFDQTSNSNPATFVAPTAIRGFAGTGEYIGGNFGVGAGSENVKEFYGEALIPLLKDAPLAKSLAINGAYRYTDYSLSGGVSSWKAGLTWQPVSDLLFRAGASRDIRAPTLVELYQGPVYANVGVVDPLTNVSTTLLQVTRGNPNLLPEISKTLTLGLTYTSSLVPGLSIALDYYRIHISNAINATYSSPLLVLNACDATNGTGAVCAQVTRPYGYSNTTAANTATQVILTSDNVANTYAAGFDIDAKYHRMMMGGNLTIRAIFTVPTVYKQVNGLGLAPINYLGNMDLNQSLTQTATGIPFYQGTIIVGYSKGPVSVSVDEQLISKVNATGLYSVATYAVAPAIQYTSLNFSYKLKNYPTAPTIFFKVDNLFDTPPPFYYTLPSGQPGDAINTNRGLYDIVGRAFTVGIRSKF